MEGRDRRARRRDDGPVRGEGQPGDPNAMAELAIRRARSTVRWAA
jgi:hypothetical protein